MGFMNRPQGWNGAPQGGGGGWQTAGGDPYQGSQGFQAFQQNGMDRQSAAQAEQDKLRNSQWGINTSLLPPSLGGTGGPQVRGGGQQSGYPGQWQGTQGGGQQGGYPGQWGMGQPAGGGPSAWSGGQGGMGGGQMAGLIQQMYSPTGQGGGSQGYGGWGGLQTNQGWR